MNSTVRWVIASIFLVSLSILGYGCGDGSIVDEDDIVPDGEMEEFIWETRGGGDFFFSIRPVIDLYTISVERYEFEPVQTMILLTEQDLEVYEFVKSIFEEKVDIHDYTYVPDPESTTGTWTTITLVYPEDQELVISHISSTENDLVHLKNFIREKAELGN